MQWQTGDRRIARGRNAVRAGDEQQTFEKGIAAFPIVSRNSFVDARN
ncbi:hypothetical protein [Azoarcus sp. KH32C]|nr:hypothetical protein [Azoarcus sp. KH32C]